VIGLRIEIRAKIDTAVEATGIEIAIVTAATATEIAMRGAMARATRSVNRGVTSVRAVKTAATRRRAAPTAPRKANAMWADRVRRCRVLTRRLAPTRHLARNNRLAPNRRSVRTSPRVTSSRDAAASPVPVMRARAVSAPAMSGVSAAAVAGGGVAAAGARGERTLPTATAAARTPVKA
jgi:hypothetical protein